MPKDKILYEIERWTLKLKKKKIFFYLLEWKILLKEKKTDIDFDELFEDIYSSKQLNPQKLKEIIGPLNNALDKIVENTNENE